MNESGQTWSRRRQLNSELFVNSKKICNLPHWNGIIGPFRPFIRTWNALSLIRMSFLMQHAARPATVPAIHPIAFHIHAAASFVPSPWVRIICFSRFFQFKFTRNFDYSFRRRSAQENNLAFSIVFHFFSLNGFGGDRMRSTKMKIVKYGEAA